MNKKKIEDYDFGRIIVNGKSYKSDIIIFWDKVRSGWWRREGHTLHVEDIADIIDENPDVIVIGTGAYGLMNVLPETENYIKSKGVKLIVKKTKEACKIFNKLSREGKKVVAALHLTC